MNIKEQFLEHLQTAATICHWGDTVRLTFTDGSNPLCNYLLEDLSSIDPRLPMAIPAMALENGISDRFNADWLRDTLIYWQGDAHIAISKTDTIGLIRNIGHIDYKENDALLRINMFGHGLHHMDGFKFIARSQWSSYLVPASDLDEQFPGWRTRYQVLRTLDVPHREVIDGTLSRNPTINADITLPGHGLGM